MIGNINLIIIHDSISWVNIKIVMGRSSIISTSKKKKIIVMKKGVEQDSLDLIYIERERIFPDLQ